MGWKKGECEDGRVQSKAKCKKMFAKNMKLNGDALEANRGGKSTHKTLRSQFPNWNKSVSIPPECWQGFKSAHLLPNVSQMNLPQLLHAWQWKCLCVCARARVWVCVCMFIFQWGEKNICASACNPTSFLSKSTQGPYCGSSPWLAQMGKTLTSTWGCLDWQEFKKEMAVFSAL